MIKPFLFLLAVMGMVMIASAPAIGTLIWMDRRSLGAGGVGLGLLVILLYTASATVALASVLYRSGLIAWVES